MKRYALVVEHEDGACALIHITNDKIKEYSLMSFKDQPKDIPTNSLIEIDKYTSSNEDPRILKTGIKNVYILVQESNEVLDVIYYDLDWLDIVSSTKDGKANTDSVAVKLNILDLVEVEEYFPKEDIVDDAIDEEAVIMKIMRKYYKNKEEIDIATSKGDYELLDKLEDKKDDLLAYLEELMKDYNVFRYLYRKFLNKLSINKEKEKPMVMYEGMALTKK